MSVVKSDDTLSTLTRIKKLSSRKNKKKIKSLIKDFILQSKDEKNWKGGYFETIKINPCNLDTIKINPDGKYFSPIYVITHKNKELAEFNALLN